LCIFDNFVGYYVKLILTILLYFVIFIVFNFGIRLVRVKTNKLKMNHVYKNIDGYKCLMRDSRSIKELRKLYNDICVKFNQDKTKFTFINYLSHYGKIYTKEKINN
jgi:hypothetical protein